MQKKFITNLAFLLFLNILIKPFWLLGVDRAVQNTVGAEVYGHYYALFNFSFLLNILLDLGITNFNNRNIAQNRQLLNKHLSGIITLRMLLAVGFMIISMIFGLIIGYEISDLRILWILLANQVLASFILYLRSNISGLHLFKTDSVLSVLDRSVMIIICSVLLWGNMNGSEFRIEWFIYAQTAAYLFTASTAFIIVASKARLRKIHWNSSFFLMILKKSYPFALLILLMSFYNRIDTVMLERMLVDGKLQSGIYAQAYRLLDASNMIAYLFAGLLLPMFAHMLKQNENVSKLLRLSFSIIGVFSISIGILAITYGQEIMNLLYVEHTEISSGIFSILMVSFFAMSATYIYGTLLTANNNLRQLNYMAAAAMAMNIILNIILIPRFEVKGAAVASLITQYTAAGIQILLAARIFRLRSDVRLVIQILLFILLASVAAYLSKHFIEEWITGLVLLTLVLMILSSVTGLFRFSGIIKILRSDTTI